MPYKDVFIADWTYTGTSTISGKDNYTVIKGGDIEIYRSIFKYPHLKLNADGNILMRGVTFQNFGSRSKSHLFLDSNETIIVKDCDLYAPGYNLVVIGTNSRPKKIIFDNMRFGVPATQQCVQILGVADNCEILFRNVRGYSASNFLRLSNRHNATGIKLSFYNSHLGIYPTSDAKKYPFWNGLLNFDDYTSNTLEECLANNQHGRDKVSVKFVNCQYWTSDTRPITPDMQWCDKNKTPESYVNNEEEGIGYVYFEKVYDGTNLTSGQLEYTEENAQYFPSVSIEYNGYGTIGYKGVPQIVTEEYNEEWGTVIPGGNIEGPTMEEEDGEW